MFKDQPIFCNCLKILTTEGLPESHFHLQFPSSGLSAIKNLKEPQKDDQLASIQMIVSNYSVSGNHWLYFPMTRRWQRSPAGDCSAGRCRSHVLPWIRNSGEQVPHTTRERQLYQQLRYLCLLRTKPLKYKWTPPAAQGAKGSGVLSMSVMQPEGFFF